MQFQILPYLENFAGINSTFHVYKPSAIHEKREIKTTSYPYGNYKATIIIDLKNIVYTVHVVWSQLELAIIIINFYYHGVKC